MKLNTHERYNSVVIEVKGDIVGGPAAEEFQNALKKIIDEGKTNVIVDLSGVKYMNSTGIGILIRGYTTVKTAGGLLKLAALTEKIQGVLSITQLNKVFEIYQTVDEAINSFQVKAL